MTYRVLSVRQPWAWAIVNGHKPVENRSWSTQHRGLTLIHASLGVDHDGVIALQQRHVHGWEPTALLDKGVIVGAVELLDVARDIDSPWSEPGSFHWLLGFARVFKQPIPVKGAMSIWELADTKLIRRVDEQLRTATLIR